MAKKTPGSDAVSHQYQLMTQGNTTNTPDEQARAARLIKEMVAVPSDIFEMLGLSDATE